LLNDESEMWKKAVVAYFMVLSRYLPVEGDENHKVPPTVYPTAGLRFEPGTSQIQRSVNHIM